MHLSLSSLCHLCAASCSEACLISINIDKGKQSNLESLVNQYITPILLLPNHEEVRVCISCNTKLKSWDSYITSCKAAQLKLQEVKAKAEQDDLSERNKKQSDDPKTTVDSVQSSCGKKKRSCNYCIARWCNKGNYQGVSLFRFPKERDRSILWLRAAERRDLENMTTLHSYYICANHFTSDMFTNKAKNKLIKKAIPTVFPKPPYADKIARKAAASWSVPKQLQGVPLKSILPKTTLPSRTESCKVLKSAIKMEPTCISTPIYLDVLSHLSSNQSSKPNPSFVVEVLSSEFASSGNTSGNVTSILKPVSSSAQSSFELPSLIPISNELVFNQHTLPSIRTVNEQGSKSNVFKFVESSPASTQNFAGSRNYVIKPDSDKNLCNSLNAESTVCFSLDSSSPRGKLDPILDSKKEQVERKQLLVDLESCFSNDEFGSNDLLSVSNRIQNSSICSKEPKRESISISEQPYTNLINVNIDVKSHFLNQSTNYQLSAGSQDLLLPHMSNNMDKASSSFTEQSSPTSDVSNEVSVADGNATNLSVLKEPIHVLNHSNEVNSAHISLFDLQSDDIQGHINSSYINNIENLDELMDLDTFFEGR